MGLEASARLSGQAIVPGQVVSLGGTKTPMANAAIYLNPEAYNTTRNTFMGRHSAGEGVLHGCISHAVADPARYP